MALTKDQAERAIRKHQPDQGISVVQSVEEFTNDGYSYDPNVTTYRITLEAPENADAPSYLLYAGRIAEGSRPPSDYTSNDFPTINHLLDIIRGKSSIPLPQAFHDCSLEIIPYRYLLFVLPPTSCKALPLSLAHASGALDERGSSKLELEIGAYLGQLHSIQNDWFGLPSVKEPVDPSYSWQESFTTFLETLLDEVESSPIASTLNLPFEDIKKCLSRAIGFFLFDDAEVPSLIGFTLSEEDIYITLPTDSTSLPSITVILPNLSWALWGDPLLEAFFMPPGPSVAVLEGYLGAGGSRPFVFPRQKTKRLWYSLFMSLVVLARGSTDVSATVSKRGWAVKIAQECAIALKDAPCY